MMLLGKGSMRRGSLAIRRSISSSQLEVVRATLPAVAAAGDGFTRHFYERLFKVHPELGNVFNQQNLKSGKQQKALFSAVAASATSVLETGALPLDMLEAIHHKHCALKVVPEQYAVVGEHILGTIEDLMAPGEEVLGAWGALYGALAAQCVKREEEIYKETADKPGGWRGERDFTVVRKQGQSENVVEFDFLPTDGLPVADYTPGQFTTVWLKGQGWEFRQPRHYTLIPYKMGLGKEGYSIAVKKGENVSKYLHETVREGDVIPLSAPFGNFHMEHANKLWLADTGAPCVLMSGGIGITPVISMLGSLKATRPVLWLHAAMNGSQHPFREYLRGLTTAFNTDFTRRVWYSEAHADDKRGGLDDNGAMYHYDGLMNLEEVKHLLPLDDPRAMYFFCGPKPWMQSVAKQLITDFKVPQENLAFENFGPSESILPP